MMTSKERLLAAFRRQPVDRIPVTLYEFNTYSDNWTRKEPSYHPLLELQDKSGDTFVSASAGGGLMGDMNSVHRHSKLNSEKDELTETVVHTPRGPLNAIYRRSKNIATSWAIKHFIENDEDIERFLSIDYKFQPQDLSKLKRLEQKLGENGVLLFGTGDPLGHIAGIFNFEEFVLRCYRDLAQIKIMLDKAALYIQDQIDYINQHFSNVCFRLWGPEYAGAPLMNPKKYFYPLVIEYVTPLVERIHAGGNFAIFHCHGMLNDILEMIAETGCDVLEPLEVLPVLTADVTMRDIKQRIGDKICLAGGMQAVDLDNGTPELIRTRVRQMIRDGGPEGLILLPTSAPLEIPLPNSIVENYRAAFEIANEMAC
ncbi:hypothetical protein JXJ21_02525 [candidate division KSB1 bacterium]|nr:hypothetical protein [candidate division KSB1 bacterium]